jgi:hypothetical protein
MKKEKQTKRNSSKLYYIAKEEASTKNVIYWHNCSKMKIN